MKHPYNTSSELDETSGNLSNDSAVTNPEPQANDKAVDEEAVWKRLEEMLEQERQLIMVKLEMRPPNFVCRRTKKAKAGDN